MAAGQRFGRVELTDCPLFGRVGKSQTGREFERQNPVLFHSIWG
jgi:hypothetical protein